MSKRMRYKSLYNYYKKKLKCKPTFNMIGYLIDYCFEDY